MPEGTLNRRLPFCRFHFLKDSFIFFINIQLALPSFKARKVLIFKWLIFSRQQIMVLHAIFFHDFQKISLISLLELLSFMNFQILKYNLTRSEGLYQFFALTGYIFLISCLLDPFMTYHAQLFSDFLQHLRESWKWPLSLINISSRLIIRKFSLVWISF